MSSDVTVDISHVTKRFGHRTIFEDVSLQVHRGEVVAIIGPSGAGKSTLIRCVNALTPFERGAITVLGHQLHGTDERRGRARREVLKEIRTHTGMVFQTFNLFPHLTVVENITLAPVRVLGLSKSEAERRARDLLASMGLTARADAYPKRMSGGEQQRVAICRALAMQPALMLFDEPTSMLDPELVGDVLDAIRQLAGQGLTMVLVTHEMLFAREVADTVAVMADGSLVEVGDARQVLTAPRSPRVRTFLNRVLQHTAGGPALESALPAAPAAPAAPVPQGDEGAGRALSWKGERLP